MQPYVDCIVTILYGWGIGAVLACSGLTLSLWLSSKRLEGPRPGSLDHFDELADIERQVYDWRREGVL